MSRIVRTRFILTSLLSLAVGLASTGSAFTFPAVPRPPVQKAPVAKGKYESFDLTYLPCFGPQGIIGIRPAELIKELPANKMVTEIRTSMGEFLAQFIDICFEGDLTAVVPPPFEDLDQCIFIVTATSTLPTEKDRGNFLMGMGSPGILRTTKPFDWTRATAKWFPKAEKVKYADRHYLRAQWNLEMLKWFLPQNPFGENDLYAAVFVADDRTLVFGNEGQIHELLDRLKAGKPTPTPPPGWQEYARDLIAMTFDTRTTSSVKGKWPTEISEEGGHSRTLLEGIKVLSAGLSIGDRTEVRFTGFTENSKITGNVLESTRWLLKMANQELMGKEGPPEQLAKQALESIKIKRDGKQFRVQFGVDGNILKTLSTMFPESGSTPVPGDAKNTGKEPNYYPTAVGSKWVYTNNQQNPSFYSVTVLKSEENEGATVITMGVREEPGKGNRIETTYAVKKDGLYFLSPNLNHGGPKRILKFPLEPGQTWGTESNIGASVFEESTLREKYTVHGPEMVEVPAGTFKALRITTDYSDNRRLETMDVWLAPGVGEVKRAYRNSVWMLQSFTPGLKSY